MRRLEERLGRGEVIILDGATGTELERRGVPMHGVAWSAAALHTHPEIVRQVHEDYIHAGADVIITNTFSASPHILEHAGMGDMVHELNTRAVTLARQAVEAASPDRTVYVAGSISTMRPANRPDLTPARATAKDSYREQAELLAAAGVDLIMLEMMGDLEQSSYAIEGAVSTGLPVWVGLSCSLRSDGSEVVLAESSSVAVAEAVDSLLPAGGSLVSIMHTDVEHTAPALRRVRDHWQGPMGAYPHSGWFAMPNWQFEGVISPRAFLSEAQTWVRMGTQLVGGCCGIGPDHIRLLREELPKAAGGGQT